MMKGPFDTAWRGETRPAARLHRRGFCLCCLSAPGFAAGAAWLTPRQAFAQARGIVDTIKDFAARTPITVTPLRGNISVLEGSGGTVAVLGGSDGKLLVDAGIGVSKPQMTGALERLGREPVVQLINTHWHFDHADGNDWLHAAGARILAQRNTSVHLATAQRVEDWDFNFPAAPPGARPAETFADRHRLSHNGQTLELAYYGPAHTDSDISVRFAEADVLHVADTFWNGVYPFIDYSTGGSIDGMIRAAEANVAGTAESTIVIAGHGKAVGTRAELREFRDMLVAIRGQVALLKARGMSRDEVVAARPSEPFDAKYGGFVIGPAFFTRLVYAGV